MSFRVMGFNLLLMVGALPLAVLAGEPAQLDFAQSAAALLACRKLVGSLVEGRPVIYTWEGHLWGRVPWERDRLLFAVQGLSVRACGDTLDPGEQEGYRLVSREVMLYLDPSSGAALERWHNPWTGEEVEVVPVANDPVNLPMSALLRGGAPAFTFPGVLRSGRAWLSLEVPLHYPSPLGGAFQRFVGGHYRAFEAFTFFADADDLLRRGRDLAHVGFSWTRVSPWLPWMAMGDRPGEVLVHAAGVRVEGWEEVPQPLRGVVETRFPAFRTPPPLDDARPNASTWSEFARLAAPSEPASRQRSKVEKPE